MQRHRDAAQKAEVCRKIKDDSRMAYVQTILHSVQVIEAGVSALLLVMCACIYVPLVFYV